ncbi:MAG TPA: bifunctional diaminohydroxyphosphoribosylaminopyrimidine deaminase/5-amino-6-(5-phosphoribosylamino)uracil reductase RibD, partial [Myxococcota bacterium]
PNPPVGAVVFRGDRVLGAGATRNVGGPHAEVVAIRRAQRRHGARALRGASIAVTLEPCDHHGRTAPCTALLIESGLRRVLVGHVDPHPTVSGRGLARLRRAGLAVTLGVLERECREQHRGFLSVCARGRPFVALKLASSLDGRIALASGQSRWITGPEARAVVHRLRAQADAVMVGSGTALADDPELTARRGDRVLRRPLRILVDSALRVPPGARLYQARSAGAERSKGERSSPERGGGGGTWVLCSAGAAAARRRRVAAGGARLIEVPVRRGRLDLRRGLALLARAGVTDLLVEGGGGLAAALLREGLVDELHWFVSPRLLGGDGKAALGPLGLASLSRARRLAGWRVRRVGEDLYVRGALAGEGG